MNLKNKILFFGIIIFIAINSIIIFLRISTNNKHNNFNYNFLYSTQKQILKIENSCEYSSIYPLFYYGKDTCSIYNFKDFNNQILIFYFSIEACQPCLDMIVDSIKTILPNYSNNANILFFSDDLEFRLRNNYFNKKIINLKYNSSLSFIKKKIATFFMLDPKTMKIHNVFVCNKQTPEFITDYLNIINKRFLLYSNEKTP